MTVVPINRAASDPRPMPASADAEQAFLGAMLVQNDVYAHVAGFLSAEHFAAEINRRVFTIAAEMIGSGRLASPITIRPFLGEHDLGWGTTWPAYLARLAAEAAPAIAARDYALTIRDLAVRRQMIAAARDLEAQAYDAPVDMRPAEIASGTLDRLGELAEDPSTTKRAAAGASAARLVAKAQEIMSGAEVASGVSTGFTDLDDATGGYRPGTLWIVAGRPGMGKSVVGGSSATKVAGKGHGVLVFSLELAEEEFAARLLADLSYSSRRPIAFSSILRGQLDEEELWTISDAQRRLERMPLCVDYSSRLSAAEIKARIHVEKKRLAAKNQKLAVVFVDYLKFVAASDRYKGNRVYEVGEISAALKSAAKDEGVCIVLLAQLNRALESREDKRPGLSDLRESGDLEADADVVAFIHREHYYLEKSPKGRNPDDETILRLEETKNRADLILGKNRSGPCKTIELFCSVGCSTMATRSKYGGAAILSPPWMPLWIAEYLADTRRLSTLEHGVYLLLIMEYWRNGGLPNDEAQLARIAGMPVSEWKKHRPSIKPFFQEGWKHKRIDRELSESVSKSASAKRAAQERWDKKRNANAHATASPNVDAKERKRISETDAKPMPLQSHASHPSDAPPGGREREASGKTEMLEQKCRKLVGDEPISVDPNFVVLLDSVGTDGITEADVLSGIAAAMAEPTFRLKYWKSLIGWARIAAKNRLEKNPKRANGADPSEPGVDLGTGVLIAEARVVTTIENHARSPHAHWIETQFGDVETFRRRVSERAPHLMKFWPDEPTRAAQ